LRGALRLRLKDQPGYPRATSAAPVTPSTTTLCVGELGRTVACATTCHLGCESSGWSNWLASSAMPSQDYERSVFVRFRVSSTDVSIKKWADFCVKCAKRARSACQTFPHRELFRDRPGQTTIANNSHVERRHPRRRHSVRRLPAHASKHTDESHVALPGVEVSVRPTPRADATS
jgi:hypothetical protein